MPLFNLQDFCEVNYYNPALVRTWLILNTRKYSFEHSIEIPQSDIEEITTQISYGSEFNFNLSKIDSPDKALKYLDFLIKKTESVPKTEDLKFKIRVLKQVIAGIDEQISLIDQTITLKSGRNVDEKIKAFINGLSLKKSALLIDKNKKKEELFKLIKLSNVERRAKFNSKFYRIAREKLFHFFPELIPVIVPDHLVVDSFDDPKSKKDIDTQILNQHFPITTEIEDYNHLTAFIEWEDVKFGEKCLFLKYKSRFFNQFPCDQSKRSYNLIKELFKNRRIAPLEVYYKGNQVIRVINLELLNFIFMFFEHSGTDFRIKNISELIKSSTPFKKNFYKKYMSEFFSNRCFSFLIEMVDDNSAIIPLPEKVVNNSGVVTIHEAFLFPIRKLTYYYWILESIEEKKATYIFKTSIENYIEDIQLLYDFLSGDFKNKRQALSRKRVDSNEINLVKRIKHQDFTKWKETIILSTKYSNQL